MGKGSNISWTDHTFFCKQDSSFRPGQQGSVPDDLWVKEFPR